MTNIYRKWSRATDPTMQAMWSPTTPWAASYRKIDQLENKQKISKLIIFPGTWKIARNGMTWGHEVYFPTDQEIVDVWETRILMLSILFLGLVWIQISIFMDFHMSGFPDLHIFPFRHSHEYLTYTGP